jgi:hypothetical protein
MYLYNTCCYIMALQNNDLWLGNRRESHAAIEGLLGDEFSTRSVLRYYKQDELLSEESLLI